MLNGTPQPSCDISPLGPTSLAIFFVLIYIFSPFFELLQKELFGFLLLSSPLRPFSAVFIEFLHSILKFVICLNLRMESASSPDLEKFLSQIACRRRSQLIAIPSLSIFLGPVTFSLPSLYTFIPRIPSRRYVSANIANVLHLCFCWLIVYHKFV